MTHKRSAVLVLSGLVFAVFMFAATTEAQVLTPMPDTVLPPDDPPYTMIRKYDENANLLWVADFPYDVYRVAVDSEDSVVAVGPIGFGARKFSSDGSLVWSIGGWSTLGEVAIDSSNNVIIGGGQRVNTWEEGVGWVSSGDGRVLEKYDSDGNLLWWLKAGVSTAYLSALAVDSQDNMLVSVHDPSGVLGGSVRKYNPDGELIWVTDLREYDNDQALDDSAEKYLVDMEVDSNDNVIGTVRREHGTSRSDFSGVAVKLNAGGDLVWTGPVLSNEGAYRRGEGVAVDSTDSMVFITGYRLSKFSSAGQLLWEADTDPQRETNAPARSVSVDHNDNIIVGWRNHSLVGPSDGGFKKYSSDGTTVFWQKAYNGVFGTAADSSNALLLTGVSGDPSSPSVPAVDLKVFDPESETFSDGPVNVQVDSPVQLSWTSEDVDRCWGSVTPENLEGQTGGWEEDGDQKGVSGTQYIQPQVSAGVTMTLHITCEDASGTETTDEVTISVVEEIEKADDFNYSLSAGSIELFPG
ncbi:MAG: hypothetical protein WD049_00195, partial [Candidatus Paceibacterota bacterium]